MPERAKKRGGVGGGGYSFFRSLEGEARKFCWKWVRDHSQKHVGARGETDEKIGGL